jgi:hypothetical protein
MMSVDLSFLHLLALQFREFVDPTQLPNLVDELRQVHCSRGGAERLYATLGAAAPSSW